MSAVSNWGKATALVATLVLLPLSLLSAAAAQTGCSSAVATPDGSTHFVDAAYCAILGRPADGAGAAYWRGRIDGGAITTTGLVRALVDSEEFAKQRRADPFRTLGSIGRVPPPAPDDGFRSRRVVSSAAFDSWVEARRLQTPSRVTPALVHGRLDSSGQRVNVAYIHVSATRGMRVSPGERGRSTVGSWAEEIGAHVAVNGNWYAPWDGPAVSAGRVYAGPDHGYTALFGATADGDWILQHHREVNEAVDERIVEGVSGHPTLLYRGERTTDFGTDPAFLNRHPRTALGIDASGDVLILVTVDGRQPGANGMTGAETAVLLEQLGAYDAVMLDGGGSSTMWISGLGVVNQPSGPLRSVGNQVAVFGN